MKFETVKNHIYTKAINAENKSFLRTVPHVLFGDLARVYTIILPNAIEEFDVTDEMMEEWGVTHDDIYMLALRNTDRDYPVTLKYLDSLLRPLDCDDMDNLLDGDWGKLPDSEIVGNAFVLGNERCYYGAAAMLRDFFMSRCTMKFNMGFYILPSSIHEVILVPSEKNDRMDELNEMVKNINTKIVRPKGTFLADHAYYVPRETATPIW